jgi:hypothetical protein
VSESTTPPLVDDIRRAQDELGRAIGRARIGEDRELANRVRELGERLAHLLLGLLRMTRMHSPDNHAFDRPVEEFHNTLVHLDELLGSIHLVAVEDQVYVNDIRIRTAEKVTSTQELGAELQRHNVGGVTFHRPLEGPAIRALIGCLGAEPAPGEPRHALAVALEAAGVAAVELQGRFRFRMAGEGGQEVLTKRADLLPRALAATDEAFQNLAAGRVPNPLPLRRVVTEILEGDLAAEELWVDLPEGPSLARHQLRVALVALLVGRSARLAQGLLQDLGVSALYHDCGYALGASGTPVPPETHPAAGAWLLLRQKGFHEAKARRIRATLEHHRDASARPHPGLFARLLRIAEDYDTLTHRAALSPTLALAKMLTAAGTLYDPVLLQLAVNALGAYPPGTLLRLEDGTVVRVATPCLTPGAFSKPLARALQLGDNTEAPADWPLLDLKDVGPVTLVQQ